MTRHAQQKIILCRNTLDYFVVRAVWKRKRLLAVLRGIMPLEGAVESIWARYLRVVRAQPQARIVDKRSGGSVGEHHHQFLSPISKTESNSQSVAMPHPMNAKGGSIVLG